MMKKRRFMNDKGYTLVEMIIVIAIVAVLAGAAMATLSILSTARVKESSTTFYAEINSLRSRAMHEIPAYDADHDGVIDDSEKDNTLFHDIKLHKDGKRIYSKMSVSDDGSTDLGVDVIGNLNGGKGTSLSTYPEIYYTPYVGARSQILVNDTDSHVIIFNKTGECIKGYGTYEFCKKNGSAIATVTIKKNGSCQIK